MILESKYSLWQIVYLKTDKKAKPRMITKIEWFGTVSYQLAHGLEVSDHYEEELTDDVDEILKEY